MAKKDEYEMALRVCRVEQQIDERLPHEWKDFAGKPMQMNYYTTKINTFRENPELQPSRDYMQWAMKALEQELQRDRIQFTPSELNAIIRQEWQTDMTRSVLEARLNRHGSKDGPVIRRSANGVLYACAQRRHDKHFLKDAIANPVQKKKK